MDDDDIIHIQILHTFLFLADSRDREQVQLTVPIILEIMRIVI